MAYVQYFISEINQMTFAGWATIGAAIISTFSALTSIVLKNKLKSLQEKELAELKSRLDLDKSLRIQELDLMNKLMISSVELQNGQQRDAAAEQNRLRSAINEQNFTRVLGNIISLKSSAFDLIEGLQRACEKGHKLDDDDMVDLTHRIIKSSREYRENMKPLFAEIKAEHYTRLESFYKLTATILLDISRTQEERVRSQGKMIVHSDALKGEREFMTRIAGALLRPAYII